ncbi:MAG: tetratricopeptide repeat protein [Saprospiraceae bacterium]
MNRVIIFGRIEYKNKRSITLARAEYVRFAETIAKFDLAYRPETLFGEDPEEELEFLHLELTREVHEAADKTLAHTIASLEKLLSFAMAGRIDVFILEAGELPRQRILEVDNDKSTVHAFNAGMEAVNEKRWEDAIGPLTDAIDGFPRHPWAYNARGHAYLELGDLEKAEADLKVSKKMYSALPSHHLGLARISHARGERSATIDNCDRAMKNSIPHQAGHWICALFKAEVLLDIVENGKTSSPDEAQSFLSVTRSLLERYTSKLRQLGSARSEHYPTPDDLKKLQKRYEVMFDEVAA